KVLVIAPPGPVLQHAQRQRAGGDRFERRPERSLEDLRKLLERRSRRRAVDGRRRHVPQDREELAAPIPPGAQLAVELLADRLLDVLLLLLADEAGQVLRGL